MEELKWYQTSRFKRIAALLLAVLLLVGAGLAFAFQFDIQKDVQLQVTATVYENGAAAGETEVEFSGYTKERLLGESFLYSGELTLGVWENEETSVANVVIDWDTGILQQYIHFLGEEKPVNRIAFLCIMDRSLQQFALQLADGRIIATSDALYQQLFSITDGRYSNHYSSELPWPTRDGEHEGLEEYSIADDE